MLIQSLANHLNEQCFMVFHRLIVIKLFLIPLLLLTSSCTEEEVKIPSDVDITVAFFDAMYNKKDLDTLLLYSSSSFQEEIKKYKTVSNVARRMFNLSFDSVSVNTQKSGAKVIDQFNEEVTMTVLLTGKRNERIFKEVKRIQLIKKNKIWLVNNLIED
jgi:hypothetical protein